MPYSASGNRLAVGDQVINIGPAMPQEVCTVVGLRDDATRPNGIVELAYENTTTLVHARDVIHRFDPNNGLAHRGPLNCVLDMDSRIRPIFAGFEYPVLGAIYRATDGGISVVIDVRGELDPAGAIFPLDMSAPLQHFAAIDLLGAENRAPVFNRQMLETYCTIVGSRWVRVGDVVAANRDYEGVLHAGELYIVQSIDNAFNPSGTFRRRRLSVMDSNRTAYNNITHNVFASQADQIAANRTFGQLMLERTARGQLRAARPAFTLPERRRPYLYEEGRILYSSRMFEMPIEKADVYFDKRQRAEQNPTTVFSTRIAPSPTGDMHLGTARTAYYNWLLARATGGPFMLRIDDTDEARSKPEHTKVILDTMAWLGLDYDVIAYQGSNANATLDACENYAHDLVRRKQAVLNEDGSIILKIDEDAVPLSWEDEIGGTIPISDDDTKHICEGIVLMRRRNEQGVSLPTYQFACVVDDIDYGINFVVRGVDHITNTSRQLAIYSALGKPRPKYAHLGLIGLKGKKLSKRDGAASMLTYRDKGYHPDAMLNFMARLGWGPKVDDKSTALLPRDKMLELFVTGGNMRSSFANLDPQKLDWYQKKYAAMAAKGETGVPTTA